MQSNLLEHIEAVRKYCAAFPALTKEQNSPEQYYMPPPAWCRKPAPIEQLNMSSGQSATKDWCVKNKKFSTGKERRNSFHGQRRYARKRFPNSRSFESEENLPEWMTHEGVWDMEAQDPVREFIRAIAFDEGYVTSEKMAPQVLRSLAALAKMKQPKVPDLDDDLDIDIDWIVMGDLEPRPLTPMEEELYAKFEAKFDRNIEALWSKDRGDPADDEEYRDLPIDFHELLASPSDHKRVLEPAAVEHYYVNSITETVWSSDVFESRAGNLRKCETPTKSVEALHDRFKPLNLVDEVAPCRPEPPVRDEPYPMYEGDEAYAAVPSVGTVMHSLILLNHSRNGSRFTEVIPRRSAGLERGGDFGPIGGGDGRAAAVRAVEPPREDLLTSARTHFRPIRRENEAGAQYVDGATFKISGDLDPIGYRRSASGYVYVEGEEPASAACTRRYLEYRANEPIAEPLPFRLKFAVCHLEQAVQTDPESDPEPEPEPEPEPRPELEPLPALTSASVLEQLPVPEPESALVFTSSPFSAPTALAELTPTPVAPGTEVTAPDAAAAAAAAWGLCDDCARLAGAKKMRQSGVDSIWSAEGGDERCGSCAARLSPLPAHPAPSPLPVEEWHFEWEDVLSDISAAHAQYNSSVAAEAEAAVGPAPVEETASWRGDRKRRHSAALRCARARAPCAHPNALVLHCRASDRPLTR